MRQSFALLVLLLAGGGCYTTPMLRGQPYDAVIVPGCPSERDGSPSECQLRRAAWAAILWERGEARNFITSGAAVYSPHVEAELLAAAMTAMGVPAERIYLDPDALHTDENMYNSMRIAQRLGLSLLAVASDRGQAGGGCSMITGWGERCTPLNVENRPTYAKLSAARDRLRLVRVVATSPWRTLRDIERERKRLTGRRRPPSALLYLWMWALRASGKNWIPPSPSHPPLIRWSDRLVQLSGTTAAPPQPMPLSLPDGHSRGGQTAR